jgi:hypothetical protein
MNKKDITSEKTNISSSQFEFQTRMFEKGADFIQNHIGRIDEILFKIKASSVTVWIALIGWGLTQGIPQMVPLGLISILGFWLLEGYFRGIQSGYIEASLSITSFLNNKEAIQKAFNESSFPQNTVYPMTLEIGDFEKAKRYGKGMIAPSVAILYLFLLFINYLLWILFGQAG